MLMRRLGTASCASLALAALACGSDGSSIFGPDESHAADDAICVGDAAPSLSAITATPATLWPPNHEMVAVRLSYLASDENLTEVSLAISSDEPENGLGDGNTTPDWAIESVAPDGASILLRTERAGPRDGRIYTIDVVVMDACDHTTAGSVQVLVPHDQGR